ncbi:MAG: YifB family Mg chelatase-like AAA ATPase [Bacteroidetes bacterium]|nr:YifB family Mg chelatase-like AAA ATPase [Bacteroidota bacterium]
MYSKLFAASTYGIDAFIVEIETHLDSALPAFSVVGLPDSTVRESRDRVTAAIKNTGYTFPSKRITVNLAPADIKKEGSAFDLPIALGILASLELLMPDEEKYSPEHPDYKHAPYISDTIILGELSLEGTLRPIHGCLSIALKAKADGYKRLLVPKINASEGALVDGIDVIPIENLKDAIDYLNGDKEIAPCIVDKVKLFENKSITGVDFADVKGQAAVKRAIEIAAAGGHNILLIGPPGSGKTMLAKRIPTILPPLTLDEALETTKIHSVAGLLSNNEALITTRPFRAPHHTISDAALIGGGVSKIKPGEISLAHHGVLFLDELPEFAKNVLEVLRQPLEDKFIAISRTKMSIEYPANFMLVCSMNPCPCGHYGDKNKACTCRPQQIQNYLSKISGPLLDRIDIHVDVQAVDFNSMSNAAPAESSEKIRERVVATRQIQIERFKEINAAITKELTGNSVNAQSNQYKTGFIYKNADMPAKLIREFCQLNQASQKILSNAMDKLGLSARAHDKILKVARTIADLEKSPDILEKHILEAIQFRGLDQKYWGE